MLNLRQSMFSKNSYCCYRFIGDIHGSYTDSESPAFEVPIEGHDKPMRAALFLRDGLPSFARIVIEDVDENSDLEPYTKTINGLFVHLISVLKLSANNYNLYWDEFVAATYPKAGATHGMSISAESQYSPNGPDWNTFDWSAFSNIFAGTSQARTILSYLTVGIDTRIPAQFRFLALFMIVERLYQRKGKWRNTAARDAMLDAYRDRLVPASYTESTFKFLNDLRNRCAHPRVGSKDEEGAHSLNPEGVALVEQALDGMIQLCFKLIESNTSTRFSETPPEDATNMLHIQVPRAVKTLNPPN